MFLQNDSIIVNIGNTVFRSFNTTDAMQFQLDPSAITGWTDGVGVKRTATPYPQGYGDFPEPTFPASRLVTMTGFAVATTAFNLHSMRDIFMGLLATDAYVQMSLTNSHGTRYATVSLASAPAWVQQTDTTATWKLDLYAPDPRIYGPIQNIQLTDNLEPGGMNYDISYPLDYGVAIKQQFQYLQNNGNVEAWPVFSVTGSFAAGFSLTDGLGNFVSYDGPVLGSSPIVIDMKAGTAVQGGNDRSQFFTQRQWFSIPAGQTISPQFIPAQGGSGWCDIIFQDTWI
jgi:hypothetical protein